MDATVRGSGAEATGLLVDVSMGGGLFRTLSSAFAVGDRIIFTVQPRYEQISGTVVRVERTWNGSLYHLEFHNLAADEERALLYLLDSCRPEFEAHQRYLASRANTGPSIPAE
jgi:hypothetical protein